ncbi:hypothetical protein LCGC14_1686590 [marine sediment metagenome]|uniref:Uncharacterized protein n=1 Tax=marine sediment metagenome TaxID=412755 RepID=A0A0F9K2K9_9ZZZZ
MTIANDIYELRAQERRRKALKKRKWKEGNQSPSDIKEKYRLNKDAVSTVSLERWAK